MSLGYMGENHGTCEETGKQFMGMFLTSFKFVERVRVRECHAD
ncbi:hypothetical protein [Dorea longicatena]|nr:hypothetical protein [Dorea longicatena]